MSKPQILSIYFRFQIFGNFWPWVLFRDDLNLSKQILRVVLSSFTKVQVFSLLIFINICLSNISSQQIRVLQYWSILFKRDWQLWTDYWPIWWKFSSINWNSWPLRLNTYRKLVFVGSEKKIEEIEALLTKVLGVVMFWVKAK